MTLGGTAQRRDDFVHTALREPLIKMVVVGCSVASAPIRLAWSAKCRPRGAERLAAWAISGPTA